ncbi:hypothetical protein [uncultured Polaribacter sp.]|uniref:hypothetical protein n=1 Tax=uncultured Polaribacter sp. TaxID=174711 RepID=UPI0026369999|nr:hypothetical protein [uncultured Polaribacter sp.]
MKKITLLLFLFSNFTFSQKILTCGSSPNSKDLMTRSYYSNNTIRKTQNEEKYIFRIFFHIIRDNNGNQVFTTLNGNASPNITEETILDAVAMLNRTYNQFNIFFKYSGFSYIDDSSLLQIDNSEWGTETNSIIGNHQNFRSDAMNLIIANNVLSSSGNQLSGRGRFRNTYSIFNNEYLLTATLPHEIAHNFNLFHTRQNSGSSTFCEYINGTNCATRGDQVCDTPASHPLGGGYVTNNGNGYIYNNFNNRMDCNGDVFANVGFTNFMDTNLFNVNNYYNNLRTEFSSGQGVRMRETIANDPLNHYEQTLTTIDELYKPYYSKILGAEGNENIYSTEDDPNIPGNVIICRYPIFINKFQKGFDYDFYTFDSWNYVKTPTNPVLDFSQTVDEVISIENKYQHAVKINQISSDIVGYTNLGGYKGLICKSESATSGKVVSLKNIGDLNYTIKNLNDKEVTNPDLIKNLESGKFHTIYKTTKSGITTQKKIYKNE